MKSSDNQIIKAFCRDYKSPTEVCKLAKSLGFRNIGKGAFTATFGKRNIPFVVKINMVSDPAAFKFYSMINGLSSRYFPTVLKLHSYVDISGKFLFIAIVEKLHKVRRDCWGDANDRAKGFVSWLSLHDHSIITIAPYAERKDRSAAWTRHNPKSMKLVSAILNDTQMFSTTDFHDANLMMRLPAGDIVLNDPVCSSLW